MENFLGLDSITAHSGWRKLLFQCLGLSLIFHILTAIFSVGHHSADEYFQILEFISFRMGKTPVVDMPVELHEQMRPWMQPAIYYCLAKVLSFLGDQNPFHWAISFRVFSGLVGWISAVFLAFCTRFWFSQWKAQKLAVFCLTWIWFFPALHARPSSESLAGSAFCIGMCIAYLTWRQDHRHRLWLPQWLSAGALLGLSFEFRFQMALMILGLVAWLGFYGLRPGRLPWRSLVALLCGGAGVFLLGRCVDFWGYRAWAFSPWNYFSFNLIRGEVSKYGVAPWWDIFRMSMTETWPVLGFIVAISSVVAWIRHPQHILTWSQIPFFLVHEMIAHKECRFFFPIASAAPILLTLSLYSSKTHTLGSLKRNWNTLWQWSWQFIALNNGIALLVLMFTPFARVVQFYEGVYDHIPPQQQKFELYFSGRDPYRILGTPIYFYRPEQLVLKEFHEYSELNSILEQRQKLKDLKGLQEPLWLFDPNFHLPSSANELLTHCSVVFRTLPPTVENWNWGNWLERTLTWTLYRCVR